MHKMERTCTMFGCNNNNHNLSLDQFFHFPQDFNLCMSWVQNCGDSRLLEDFVYGGASLFLNRFICSHHFNSSDFVNPEDQSLGIKPNAVPLYHFVYFTLKKEPDENAYEEYLSEEQIALCIKNEPDEMEIKDKIVTAENDLHEYMLPTSEIENTVINNAFDVTWKNTLKSTEQQGIKDPISQYIDENETKHKIRNQANAIRNADRRAKETQDQRRERLYKNAVRAALRRSMETEQEQKLRRQKNALRAAYRRNSETEEQKAARRLKDKLRSAERRQRETEIQAKLRKYNDAVRAAFRRSKESFEERQQRRMYDVIRASKRRKEESTEQRQKRLKADRERAARRRFIQKIEHNVIPKDPFYEDEVKPYFEQFNVGSVSNSSNECEFTNKSIESIIVDEFNNTIVQSHENSFTASSNNYLTHITL